MWSLQETSRRLYHIRELPYGKSRTAASEWIVRTIEAEGPVEKLPEALIDLLESYTFGTPSPHIFAVSSRLLRLWDEHPEYFDEQDQHNLFWTYKWVAHDLQDYYQISVEQARAFLDDMRRRFRLAGHGTTAADEAEFFWALHLGNMEEAKEWKDTWFRQEGDPMECPDCRHSTEAKFLIDQEKYEEALKVSIPQRARCNRQPSASGRFRAWAHLELGQGKEAYTWLLRAQASRDPKFFDPYEYALEFMILARGGQIERGLRLLRDKCRKVFTEEYSPGTYLSFLFFLISGLSAAMDQPQRLTHIPEGKTVEELRSWAIAQATPLIEAFDKRSGNTSKAKKLEKVLNSAQVALLPFDTSEAYATQQVDAADALSEGDSSIQQADTSSNEEKPARTGFTQRIRSGLRSLNRGKKAGDDGSVSQAEISVSGTSAAEDPEAHYQLADAHLNKKEYAQAASYYALAAQGRQSAGLLADAGLAWADCAQCQANLEEYSLAHESFSKAWDLLVVGGASPSILVTVLQAWGASAEQMSRVIELNEPLTQLEAILLAAFQQEKTFPHAGTRGESSPVLSTSHTVSGLSGHTGVKENAEDSQSGVEAENTYENLSPEENRMRASFLELKARVLAASAPSEEQDRVARYEEASHLAGQAAQIYASSQALEAAGYAFALVGKLQHDVGNIVEATWGYESAIEAFTLTHRKKARAEVLDSFIELLRQTGQDDRVEEIVAKLTE